MQWLELAKNVSNRWWWIFASTPGCEMLRLSRSSNGVCPCSQIPHVCFLEASKKYSEARHCLIVDTYTAGSEEHFCKEKVWLTPSSNKVFMVSSMPSLGRTTCLTHRGRPHRPYFLLCTVFRVLPVDASQYNLFCMHMKYLYPKYTQKHCSNISIWIDGLSFSPGWLNV